ncbi:uncharacterized protein LAESUDRAFT_755858 [Laetiporus sulphureus 93-53]|uniref:DUF6533 domain-containing protein n=1 Tax=Laetiporus sulphureus 93-53 TaxID=1314785 RepID=A0A165GHB3_9APHY|nr:uncharacterized protein LAESUDRAFT_755858 [Laetiporus sulphureus 93-53]KZT10348.1 hypothetical protein LAESUDRAFT_755858 [Laetiporus sulphureus 93-53]
MVTSETVSEYADITVIKYLNVAATCCLVYDMLIHLGDEIEYIWKASHSWMKWIYAFIRHFPYIVPITINVFLPGSSSGSRLHSNQCRGFITYQFIANEALTVAVEAILIARVCAMFNRNKPVVGLVIALFAMEVAAMITVLAFSIPRIQFSPTCLITHTPSIFTSYWLWSLAFETFLFALTLIRFFSDIRRGLSGTSVLYILVRDGMWAYAVIFAIMLLNTLCYHLIDGSLAGLCFCWEFAIMSIAGSHVLLNLRRFSHRSHESDGTTLRMELLGSIEFAGRSMPAEADDWMSDTVITSTAGHDMT